MFELLSLKVYRFILIVFFLILSEYEYQFNVTASNNFDGKLTVSITGTNGTTGPVQLMRYDI